MEYIEYSSIKNKFSTLPNLCDLFKLLAIETWKRMEYAYLKPGVKVFETTLTQNLIFSINAYNDQYNLNIDIFEAKDERTNGNDFELIIRFPNDRLEYYAPIQAKKINRKGKYASLDHGVQIESLINYADSKDAKPFYLLYNFTTTPIKPGVTLTTPIELTGCALITAEYLFSNHYNQRRNRNGVSAWIIPDFYSLNPSPAIPWHELVCPDNAIDFYQILKKNGVIAKNQDFSIEKLAVVNNDIKQGFYPINTFTENKNWVNIKDLYVDPNEESGIYSERPRVFQALDEYEFDRNERSKNNSSGKERVFPNFSPKSRIILNK